MPFPQKEKSKSNKTKVLKFQHLGMEARNKTRRLRI